MPIIIDGWNFIRNSRSLIRDDEGDSIEAARDLICFFEDFQRTHGDPIVLVFDSTREHLDVDHRNSDRLKVVAAHNADSYMKRYIDKTPERQRRNLRVISSDKDVFYYAKSSYATPIRSEEFWERLKRNRAKHAQ